MRNSVGPSNLNFIGSIDTLNLLTKITNFYCGYCENITGDIETTCVNWSRLYYIQMMFARWSSSSNWYSTHNIDGSGSDKIYGNISVFTDKYDLKWIQIMRYSNIIGEVKDLKNLKKLTYFNLDECGCTGSQADLYNNGANLTTFRV